MDYITGYARTLSFNVRSTIFIITVAIVVGGLSGIAHSEGAGFYTGVKLGMSRPTTTKNSLDTTVKANKGIRISGVLGYGNGESLRGEAELFRSKASIYTLSHPDVSGGSPQDASGNVSAVGLMANGYYDFKTDMPIVPYVGAGVGAVNVSVNDVTASGFLKGNDSDRVLAWQLKAGISYPVSDKTSLTFGYRFFDTKDLSLVTSAGTPYTADGARSHSLETGLRYVF